MDCLPVLRRLCGCAWIGVCLPAREENDRERTRNNEYRQKNNGKIDPGRALIWPVCGPVGVVSGVGDVRGKSVAVLYRWSGFGSRALKITRSTGGGMPGTILRGEGGRLCICIETRAIWFSAMKGRRPVTISYSSTPSE